MIPSLRFYVQTLRLEEFAFSILGGAIACVGAGVLLPIDFTDSLNGGRVLGVYAPLIIVPSVGILFSSPWGEQFQIASTGRDIRVYRGVVSFVASVANLVIFAALVIVGAEMSIAIASFWIGWLALGVFYLLNAVLALKTSTRLTLLLLAIMLSAPMFDGPNQFVGDNVAAGISLLAKILYLSVFFLGIAARFFVNPTDRFWLNLLKSQS